MPNRKLVVVLFGIFLFIANILRAEECKFYCDKEVPKLVVEGYGIIVADPDKVEFNINLRTEEKRLDKAFEVSTKKINSVTEVLKRFKVKDEDIKNLGYRYTPLYEGKPLFSTLNRPTSYEIIYNLKIRILNLNDLGKILMDISGVAESKVSNLNFGSTKIEELKRDALKKAAEDARLKAIKLCEGAGTSLGTALEIRTSAPVFQPRMMNYYDGASEKMSYAGVAMEAAPAPEIQAGSLEITANCTITYKLIE